MARSEPASRPRRKQGGGVVGSSVPVKGKKKIRILLCKGNMEKRSSRHANKPRRAQPPLLPSKLVLKPRIQERSLQEVYPVGANFGCTLGKLGPMVETRCALLALLALMRGPNESHGRRAWDGTR